jgi:hypothetical protein
MSDDGGGDSSTETIQLRVKDGVSGLRRRQPFAGGLAGAQISYVFFVYNKKTSGKRKENDMQLCKDQHFALQDVVFILFSLIFNRLCRCLFLFFTFWIPLEWRRDTLQDQENNKNGKGLQCLCSTKRCPSFFSSVFARW